MNAFTQLELPLRYLADGRDRSVIAFPLPSKQPSEVRLLVNWDADRDARIVAVLAALFFRDPDALSEVVAVGEARGAIDVWVRSPGRASEVRRAFADAADRAIYSDSWSVNEPRVAPTRGTVVDWEKIPPEDSMHGTAKRYQLGVVERS